MKETTHPTDQSQTLPSGFQSLQLRQVAFRIAGHSYSENEFYSKLMLIYQIYSVLAWHHDGRFLSGFLGFHLSDFSGADFSLLGSGGDSAVDEKLRVGFFLEVEEI